MPFDINKAPRPLNISNISHIDFGNKHQAFFNNQFNYVFPPDAIYINLNSLLLETPNVNDWAVINAVNDMSASSLSLSFWIKTTASVSTASVSPRALFWRGDGSGSFDWFVELLGSDGSLAPSGSNEIIVRTRNNHLNGWFFPGGVMALNHWYNIVLNLDGTSTSSICYIDGVFQTSSFFSPPVVKPTFLNTPGVPFSIGDRPDGAWPSQPIIFDEVAVFCNNIRTQSDATRYASNGSIDMTKESGIASFWGFNGSLNDLVGINHLSMGFPVTYSVDHP